MLRHAVVTVALLASSCITPALYALDPGADDDPQPDPPSDQPPTDDVRPGDTVPDPPADTEPEDTFEYAPIEGCGNGIKEGLEECDGADLGGDTCQSLGIGDGTLSCDASCQLVTTGCTRPRPSGVWCDNTTLRIRADAPNSVSSTITVPDRGTVDEVQVLIRGQHQWIGDLEFSLARAGTVVLLASPDSFFGDCDQLGTIDAIFSDSGASSPDDCDVGGNYLGTRYPVVRLSAFAGSEMSGDWTLLVDDLVSADGGEITSWCLRINP